MVCVLRSGRIEPPTAACSYKLLILVPQNSKSPARKANSLSTGPVISDRGLKDRITRWNGLKWRAVMGRDRLCTYAAADRADGIRGAYLS
jgi:hypothetical protein